VIQEDDLLMQKAIWKELTKFLKKRAPHGIPGFEVHRVEIIKIEKDLLTGTMAVVHISGHRNGMLYTIALDVPL
jgi:hypothetical protein